MSNAPEQTAAASCSYCGRQNPDRLPTCPGCGTPLVSEPYSPQTEPKTKSRVLAVCLALVFGPLGLFYVGAWQAAFIMMFIGAPFVLTHTGGLWLTIGSRILCATWAYCAAIEQARTPNTRRDSKRLLEEAARLENVDRSKAVAVCEQIIRLYPDTPA